MTTDTTSHGTPGDELTERQAGGPADGPADAHGGELADVVRRLNPKVRSGAFVVVSLPSRSDVPVEAIIHEDEAVTHVVARDVAKAEGWDYDFVAGWITLGVATDLALVGLTAIVATALAEHGISCNVLAGHRHDHLLVPLDRLDDALLVLARLSRDH